MALFTKTLRAGLAAGLQIACPFSASAAPLPSWADQMEALKAVGERLVVKAGHGGTEAERQEMYSYILGTVSNGYLDYVSMDMSHPTWAPLWNYAYNYGGPNPDYAYMITLVDPKGVYRISGYRGTSVFVEISQQPGDLAPIVKGPSPATNDLDTLHLGKDGYFSVILSAERPAGYEGDWWKLYPATGHLLMRKTSNDWRHEIDPRVAIDRLDSAPPMSPEERARRFSNLSAWVTGMMELCIDLAHYYREHIGINTIQASKVTAGNGGFPGQVYLDGSYQIADDEALVLDTALPAHCRYWQILVADDRFATVDWVNHQSSLNGAQARIDTDGRFRAVISARDPGVPNWLDTAGNRWGVLQMRWNRCTDAPTPTVTKVALKDVRKLLPADTPVVGAADRKAALQDRREAAQLRHLW
jgi:hypothetical protein